MIKKIAICFLLLSCNAGVSRQQQSQQEFAKLDGVLKVTKVVDGDTFWLIDEKLKKAKIRLIGVDAPESRNAFKKKIGHYGKESKQYLKNLISDKFY